MKAIDWNEKLVERLCAEIASGRAICEIASEEWCPSEPSIYRKMANDQDFAALVAIAREAQQDHEVEACVKMADSATPEDWQVVKLRIWARQWRASKLAPKRYGDRQSINLGGQPGNPVQTQQQVDIAALSPEQREALAKIGRELAAQGKS